MFLSVGLAQVSTSEWSSPELIFASSPAYKSNELWLLRDQADILYLWWSLFEVEEQKAKEGGESAVWHTQWLDGQWQEAIDVLLWPQASGLTSVVIDATGMLHAFSTTDCISYVRAPHNQAMEAWAWSSRQCLDSTGNTNPAVAQSPDGTIYVVYASSDTKALLLINSSDDGATWSSPWMVTEVYNGFIYDPAIAIDEQDRLHVAWTELPPETYPPQGVFYARSDDRGEHWTTPIQLGKEDEGQPAIAVHDNDVHVLWNGDAAKRGRYYRYSWDAGEHWEPVKALSDPASSAGGLQRPPAIIVDNIGHVHALLHEQETLYYITKNEYGWTSKQLMYDPSQLKAWEIYTVRLAITGGNQLHALYTIDTYTKDHDEDRDNHTYRIYHQYHLIEAQAEAPMPYSTPHKISPSPTVSKEIMASPTPSSLPRIENDFTHISTSSSVSNPSFPILVSVMGVLVLLGVIMIMFIIQRRRL